MPPFDSHLPPSRSGSPPNNAPDPEGQSFPNSASMNPSGTSFGNPERDAGDENIRFLRSNQLASIDASLERMRNRRRRQLHHFSEGSDAHDSSEQRRQPGPVSISRRIPIVRRQRENLTSHLNYGGASRSQHLESVYGWAPGSDDNDDDEQHGDDGNGGVDDHGLEGRDSAESQYRSGQRSHTADIIHYVWRSSLEEDQNNGGQLSGSSRATTSREGGGPSSTLRYGDSNSVATAALLQSVRRHPRFSSRTRTLQNYILGRERSGLDVDDRDWMPPTSNPAVEDPDAISLNRRNSTRNINTGSSELRQLYLEEPPSDRLEETIKYLEMLRSSEGVASSPGLSFDRVIMNGADFVRDASSIYGPAGCSWLQPGSVFSGSQHAMHCNSPSMLSHRIAGSPRGVEAVVVNGSEPNRIRVYTSSGRNYWARNSVGLENEGSPRTEADGNRHEHWPVKVTIHSVNYNTMTITGTMEAFNIPDKTAGSQGAHIITYLEGEIIDFKTHSLDTKNFQASTDIDGLYWRKLEPFKDIPDDQLARNLVSKTWLNEHLAKGWILMRWKERCFVSPSHSRQGLTISGFYYISLCRENGSVQGMYYDPGSSPYQHLSLGPELKQRMVFPAYSFR